MFDGRICDLVLLLRVSVGRVAVVVVVTEWCRPRLLEVLSRLHRIYPMRDQHVLGILEIPTIISKR